MEGSLGLALRRTWFSGDARKALWKDVSEVVADSMNLGFLKTDGLGLGREGGGRWGGAGEMERTAWSDWAVKVVWAKLYCRKSETKM